MPVPIILVTVHHCTDISPFFIWTTVTPYAPYASLTNMSPVYLQSTFALETFRNTVEVVTLPYRKWTLDSKQYYYMNGLGSAGFRLYLMGNG